MIYPRLPDPTGAVLTRIHVQQVTDAWGHEKLSSKEDKN